MMNKLEYNTESKLDLLFEEQEISLFWDLAYTIPCCAAYPSKLVNYFETWGKLIKSTAIVRRDLRSIIKYLDEVKDAGFRVMNETRKKTNFKSHTEKSKIAHFVISGDENFMEYLSTIPDAEIILISDPMVLSKTFKHHVFPFFYICDCEMALMLRKKWCLIQWEKTKKDRISRFGSKVKTLFS